MCSSPGFCQAAEGSRAPAKGGGVQNQGLGAVLSAHRPACSRPVPVGFLGGKLAGEQWAR